MFVVGFVLFDFILYVPLTIFQLCRDGPSWVEPVLSWDYFFLPKDTMQVATIVQVEVNPNVQNKK